MKTKISDQEAVERLEQLDPDTAVVRDRSAVAAIESAVQDRDDAEARIEAAVIAARRATPRVTWVEIGAALGGLTHQAARQRYNDKV